jgi:ABC-2 type transport system permease protein
MPSCSRHNVKDNMDPIDKHNTSPTLSPGLPNAWTAAQSRAQFAALAKLRWNIFRNAFRRKGGGGELVARLIILPIIGFFAFGPILGSGFAAHLFVSSGRVFMLPILTWALFALWLLVLLNLSPPGLSFDINTILRFPLSFPRYLTARIFFGLLSASTVIGTLSVISAAIGISLARPSLALWSTILLAIYAFSNIFFTRMMLVWVERWLSTRRAREILTALILFGSLGFQYINLNFNPGLQGRHHHASTHLPLLLSIFHHIKPVAAFLPPGLAASSIVSFSQGHLLAAIASLLGLIAFAALFFSVYAWRMHREFLGENLSETAQPNRPAASQRPAITPVRPTLTPGTTPIANAPTRALGLNSAVIACLQKEFIYLQRNLNQLYGFIAPLFMVFLFASRMSSSGRFGELVFPAAVAYSTLGVSTLSYNALGMDGPGVQFYLLSPTRLRDVFLAKNLMTFLLTLTELVLIFGVIVAVTHAPSPIILLATVAWLLFTTFLNAAIGNLRSILAPRKVDLMKASRKQISQLSALLALAMIVGCAAIGAVVLFLCNYLDRPWLMIPIFLTLAIIAFIVYLQVLSRLDTVALTHRETLTEELCKA